MKLVKLTKTWDWMPENAFDHVEVAPADDAKAVYTKMYAYGVELEAEILRQREKIEMYKKEIQALNKANARKAFRLNVAKLFNKVF